MSTTKCSKVRNHGPTTSSACPSHICQRVYIPRFLIAFCKLPWGLKLCTIQTTTLRIQNSTFNVASLHKPRLLLTEVMSQSMDPSPISCMHNLVVGPYSQYFDCVLFSTTTLRRVLIEHALHYQQAGYP